MTGALKIDQTMQAYLVHEEMLCGALVVRQADRIVYQNKWGFTDIERRHPVAYDSVYRMMSMTKPVIGVGIMMLAERGLLSLDDPVRRYIPSFGQLRVSADERYRLHPGVPLEELRARMAAFDPARLKTEPLKRDITLLDLMSHSSGLGQGIVGMLTANTAGETDTLAERVEHMAHSVLDFQPGEGTGYSAAAGFDVLGRIIELISGETLERFCEQEIFAPLEMKDTCFRLSEAQKARLVALCVRKEGKLVDITADHEAKPDIFRAHEGYVSGSAGLFSTLEDYEHFARMLCCEGKYQDRQFLQPATVARMRTEAPAAHMEPLPGQVWGLSMRIRQTPEKGGLFTTPGTYGWSGAYGTHFFVSPADELACVFVTNRGDVAGSESYLSLKVEELVFDAFGRKA